ncbi:hypothetical protein GW17_00035789 [Ensete ventricosum]|nr:hypothetical protein GW17_00035789 [Ensete ventricosum]RZR78520.1 hypothetical protein BHM03_00003915 [Ensete ventricosum]
MDSIVPEMERRKHLARSRSNALEDATEPSRRRGFFSFKRVIAVDYDRSHPFVSRCFTVGGSGASDGHLHKKLAGNGGRDFDPYVFGA